MSRLIKAVLLFFGTLSFLLVLILVSFILMMRQKTEATHEFIKLYSPDRKLVLMLDNLGKGGSFYVYKNGESVRPQDKILITQVCTDNMFYWHSNTELVAVYNGIELSDFKSYPIPADHRFRMRLCDSRERECGEKNHPVLRVPYCSWND
jgi:hypothetical protein